MKLKERHNGERKGLTDTEKQEGKKTERERKRERNIKKEREEEREI